MSLRPVMLEQDRMNWRSLVTHARCAAQMVEVKRSAKAFEIIAKACWHSVMPSQVPDERLPFLQLVAFGKSWVAMDAETRAVNAEQVRQLADRCAVLIGEPAPPPPSPPEPPRPPAARLPYADDSFAEKAA